MRQFLLFSSLWAMVVGYRTVDITPGLLLHPLDLLLWSYWLVTLAQGKVAFKATPVALLLVLGLSFISALGSPRPWPTVVSDLKSLLLIIPVFTLMADLMKNRARLDKGLRIFFSVAVLISLFGIFEYQFPGLAAAIPFFGNPGAYYSFGAFYRAQFSFFGNPIAAILPLLTLAFYPFYKLRLQRWQYYAVNALFIYSIYICGFRSFWAAGLLAFGLHLWLNKQLKYLALLPLGGVAAGVVGINLLPAAASARFLSAFSALGGEAEIGESSGELRVEMITRILDWDILTRHFFGHGLGAAGWVHSDLLMIAYNSGLITAFILALFVLRSIWRALRFARQHRDNPMARSLVAVLPTLLMILIFQAFVVRPQLAVPLYFVLALIFYYPRYARGLKAQTKDEGEVEPKAPAEMEESLKNVYA